MKKLLSCAVAMIVAMSAFGAVQKPVEPTAEQLKELEKYIHPLRTAVPDGGDDRDLEVLKNLFGDASIVGLGEATHGTHEIFQMKDRLVRYMARNMGFDIFSIEAALADSYEVENYTVCGEGTAAQWIGGMGFWIWNTEEMCEMVEWMRRYNNGERKIAFTGFDMQSATGAFRALERIYPDDETILSVEENLKKLMLPADSLAGLPHNYFRGELAHLAQAIGGAKYSALPDSMKYRVEQLYTVIQQCTESRVLGNADISPQTAMWVSSALRDFFMAQNIGIIKDLSPSKSKMVVWAHNSHIATRAFKMGTALSYLYGDDYLTVGFALGTGAYSAFNYETRDITSDNILAPPPPDSYEYILSQLPGDIFIVDLRRMKAENRGSLDWFLTNRSQRTIGATAIPAGQNQFTPIDLAATFDYLIFIRNSTASRLLPTLE